MFVRFSLIAVLVSAPLSLAFAQGTPQQRAACRPDVVKFCKGKGEDPGVLLQCLEDNKDKISEKCRGVIAEVSGTAPTAEKKEAAPAATPEKKEEKPAELRNEKK